MDGAPLKLISTGWSRRSTAIFGSKEPSPRWVPWQQPTWASAFGAVLSHASDQKWQARFFLSLFFLYYVASLALPLVHSSASPFLSPCDMVLVCPGGCEKIAEGECLWENVARQPKQHVTARASLYGLGQKRGTSWDGLSELRSCCWMARLQQIKQSCASEAFVVCAFKTELNLCLNSQSFFTACFIANFSRSWKWQGWQSFPYFVWNIFLKAMRWILRVKRHAETF